MAFWIWSTTNAAAVLQINRFSAENAWLLCVGFVKRNFMAKIKSVEAIKIFKIGPRERQGI